MRDRIDEMFDEMKAEAVADWNAACWKVGRWIVPISIALIVGPIIYAVLK